MVTDLFLIQKEIERQIIDLLSKEAIFLSLIQKLSSKDSSRKEVLNHLITHYEPILKPLKSCLNEQIWFCWGGVVFWDFFADSIGILSSFVKNNGINLQRYYFISNFLSWEGFDFKEPLSHVVFHNESKQIPLVFSLKELNVKYNENVIIQNFSFLNEQLHSNDELNREYNVILSLINKNNDNTNNNEKEYSNLKSTIIKLSDKIILDERIKRTLDENIQLLNAFQNKKITEIFNIPDLCNVLIWNKLIDETWNYLYFIPTQSFKKLGVGGLVLATSIPISEDDFSSIILIVNRICGLFGTIYQFIYNEYILTLNSKKSAIAAIMSRNMSHNLGSHSLVNLGKLNFINNLFEGSLEKISQQFYPDSSRNNEFNSSGDRSNYKKTAKEYLKIYINNLRRRMDLIADMVTSVPTSENARNLKYDVLEKFISNFLLANTISGTNNFSYQINYYGDGHNVSIPNDILGMDSFSIILENMIRNTAKHGTKKDEVILTIDVEDGAYLKDTPLPEYYKVTIFENCKNGCKNCKLVNSQNLNINKDILDERTNTLRPGAWGVLEMKIAAAYLRKIPAEEIDDKKNKLSIDKEGKWIKNKEKDFNDKSKDNPYILKACCKRKKGFGYSFFLRKPKVVLIFDFDNKILIDGNNKDSFNTTLLNDGIQLIQGENEILVKIRKSNFNHPILLCISRKNVFIDRQIAIAQKKEIVNGQTISRDLTSGIPNRIIWIDPEDTNSTNFEYHKGILKCLQEGATDSFIKKVWDLWDVYFWGKMKQKEFEEITINGKEARKNGSQKIYEAEFLDHAEGFINKKRHYIDIGSSFSFSKLPFQEVTNIPDLKDKYENVRDNVLNKMPLILLHESFITKIGIIDERIHSFIDSKYYAQGGAEIPFKEIFEKMNIFLPPLNINLNSSNFNQNRIVPQLNNWLKLQINDFDFLIIHLGIIEKLIENKDKDSVKAFIDNIQIMNPKLKIIIISGRGKPHNLPDDIRFLNYSQVAYCTCDDQSKFILTDLCQSARKI